MRVQRMLRVRRAKRGPRMPRMCEHSEWKSVACTYIAHVPTQQ